MSLDLTNARPRTSTQLVVFDRGWDRRPQQLCAHTALILNLLTPAVAATLLCRFQP
jgi:hypothetical protein